MSSIEPSQIQPRRPGMRQRFSGWQRLLPGWVSARPPRRSAQLVSRIDASRVAGDAERRVVESRLRLESDVRKLLREVSPAPSRP